MIQPVDRVSEVSLKLRVVAMSHNEIYRQIDTLQLYLEDIETRMEITEENTKYYESLKKYHDMYSRYLDIYTNSISD